MKLSAEQLEAAGELLKRRIEKHGGSAAARARELCAGELKGWVTAEELIAAYRTESAPQRWVDGDHERDLDYYDPEVLAAKASATPESAGDSESTLLVEREAIARILRRLESGGGLLKRKVRWLTKYYTLQTGEQAVVRKGPGQVQCGSVREEWLSRAVLILQGETVVKVFPEARLKNTRPVGWSGKKKPVIEMRVPELDLPELGLRRIAMNVAVLLRRLRRIDSELKSAADIARAAGVTRANVSARQIKMEAEEAAEGPAEFKKRRRRRAA